jgi:DNA-binding GntR family transcriptional regulator
MTADEPYLEPVIEFPADMKQTKSTLLVDRLREAIISGVLKPGEKINLDRVRQDFDISLSPLREALARLIASGLVEFHDNRGYTVAPVSPSNLAEITRLRVECESLALSSAIACGDARWEGDVIRALHHLNRIERDPLIPKSIGDWEAAHRGFHMILISSCNLPLLLNFCLVLHNLHDRYRRVFLATQGGDRNVAMEHSEIAQAAVARDAVFATAKLREHIQRTGDNLLARLSGVIVDQSMKLQA